MTDREQSDITYQVLHAHPFMIHNGFKSIFQMCAHKYIHVAHCIQVPGSEKVLFRFMPALHELRKKKQSKNLSCSTKKNLFLVLSLAAFIQNICSVEVIMNRLILPTIEQSAGTAVQRNYFSTSQRQ